MHRLEFDPDAFPDTSVRNPDTGRKKRSKIALFSTFFEHLRGLCMKYQLGGLIQCKYYAFTSFLRVLKNFDQFRAVKF